MSLIYISGLPKDKLLYELWRHARPSPFFLYCKDKLPMLTLTQARLDINEMLKNNYNIYLNTYYGKTLYIDISGDVFDMTDYAAYNRIDEKKVIEIINKLKIEELNQFILKYYIFF